MLGFGALVFKGCERRAVSVGLPSITPVDFVQCHHERGVALFQKLQRLQGLILKSMHQIDHQNSNIAQTRTSRSQVAETLVARGVNDQQARNVHIHVQELFALADFFVQFFLREKCCSNLLGDTSSLAFLDVGTSDLVQKGSLTGIDVSQDGANGASELSLLPFEENTVVS